MSYAVLVNASFLSVFQQPSLKTSFSLLYWTLTSASLCNALRPQLAKLFQCSMHSGGWIHSCSSLLYKAVSYLLKMIKKKKKKADAKVKHIFRGLGASHNLYLSLLCWYNGWVVTKSIWRRDSCIFQHHVASVVSLNTQVWKRQHYSKSNRQRSRSQTIYNLCTENQPWVV